jgi:hypothetical protein
MSILEMQNGAWSRTAATEFVYIRAAADAAIFAGHIRSASILRRKEHSTICQFARRSRAKRRNVYLAAPNLIVFSPAWHISYRLKGWL